MSSIFGVATREPMTELSSVLERMASALPPAWEGRGDTWRSDDGRAAVGYGVHRRTPVVGQTSTDRSTGTRCWVEGVFGGPDLEVSAAGSLLAAFLARGADSLHQFPDSYNVALWSPAERRLTLANDRFGYRPLYVAIAEDRVVFATHMAQLAASGLVELRPNPRSLAELLGANSLLSDNTVFEQVEVLGPGSVVEFSPRRATRRRVYRIDEIEATGSYDAARRERLADTFLEATRWAGGAGRTGIALSGGLDSRCLMAAAGRLGLRETFTEGPVGSHDCVLASRVARKLGAAHRRVELATDSAPEWLEAGMSLLGGNVASLEVHPCHHFMQPTLPFGRIVLGLVGEFSRSAYPRPTDFVTPDFETVLKRVSKKVLPAAGTTVDKVLWLPEHRELSAWTERRLEEKLRSYRWQDSPIDVADYYYVEIRGRRALAKGPTLGRLGCETATPYLHPPWAEEVLSVPTRERLQNRIQMDLIDRFAPELNRIPYTKPRAYTTPWEERIGEAKIEWKRRLRLGRLGLGGVRRPPAFDVLGWTRGALRPALEELLYSPDAAFQSYLDGNVVRDRLEAHFEGGERHLHLVAALAAFETAHRMWATTPVEA